MILTFIFNLRVHADHVPEEKGMMRKDTLFICMLAGMLMYLLGGASLALAEDSGQTHSTAEQGNDVSTSPSNPYALPPVVVTADKRESEVQETPMAITVLSSQDIQDGSIYTIDDVLQRIPNLQVGHFFGGSSLMTFRGMPTATGTNTNPLVIYIDGVPADTVLNLDANLMDIERVEVLRGAQSVIYGKNTLGGIINIITKKPDNNFAGNVFARVESYGSYAGGASIRGPIKEDLLYFSLSAMHEYNYGFMDNPNSNDRDSLQTDRVKGQLRLTPTNKSEFALLFDYTVANEDMPPYTLGDSVGMTSHAASSDYDDSDVFNVALSGKMQFAPLTFESITTTRIENQDYAFDMNNIMPGAFLSDGGRKVARSEITQEFRFRSPDEAEGLIWLAGVFGSYTDLDMKEIEQKYQQMGPLHPYLNQPYREFTQDFAPFGQIEIPLADEFTLTTGLRWHYTHKRASINYEPNADMQLMGQTPMSTRETGEWDEWLPRVNLKWQPTDDHMLYASVSRSFIPGGYNYAATAAYELTYDSETAWNYELGAKTSWFGDRLIVNPVLYYIQLEDLQVMSWDPSAGLYTADNAGRATSYGAELDITYRILPFLDAEFSGGYTHAKYDEYSKETITGTSVYDDNWIPNTPRFSAMAALQYRHERGFFARGEVFYTDKMYWDDANDYARNDVTTVNLRVGYEMDDFDIYLYAKNLFDERYQQYFSSANKIGFTAQPQTFGLEARYRF